MNNHKIITPAGKFVVQQNVQDLKEGHQMNDYSRITLASGKDKGLHVGHNSPPIGRHGGTWGK